MSVLDGACLQIAAASVFLARLPRQGLRVLLVAGRFKPSNAACHIRQPSPRPLDPPFPPKAYTVARAAAPALRSVPSKALYTANGSTLCLSSPHGVPSASPSSNKLHCVASLRCRTSSASARAESTGLAAALALRESVLAQPREPRCAPRRAALARGGTGGRVV